MSRRGWTLHELLISLGVMGGVIGLAAHAATAQLRFFAGSAEVASVRTQISHASTIAASVLWGLSASGGDIIAAQDSAIEVYAPIGSALVCASTAGNIIMTTPTSPGQTLASFPESPGVGDRLLVLLNDSSGSTWLTMRPASSATTSAGCPHFAAQTSSLAMPLVEPIALPAGAPLRFARRTRLSLYRGSDTRWYLGTRAWNGDVQAFNTVQPVAGPLSPYSHQPDRTGLRFVYRGADGLDLADPVDTRLIASITVVARSRSVRFEDSTSLTVALRNAP
jgi:hypothetical protein